MEFIDWWISFIDRLKSGFATEEILKLDNGTLLIKNLPNVAKFAYLHKIFGPKDIDRVCEVLECQLNRCLPQELVSLYKYSNGMSLFEGEISIYGIKSSGAFTIENVLREPFDIIPANLYYHPQLLKNDRIIVGGFKEDGSVLTMNLGVGVFRLNSNSGAVMQAWNSLTEFLDSTTGVPISRAWNNRESS